MSYYVVLPEEMTGFQLSAEAPIFGLLHVRPTYNAHPAVLTKSNGTPFPEISNRK
jgi:hypothetical protein